MNANAIDDPEVKRYRLVGAALRTVIAFGVVAGLAAIGANAPERRHMTMNCAYDPAATGTLSDASGDVSSLCADNSVEAEKPAVATGQHSVPDASTALDPRAEPEPLPPTF